MTRLPTVLAAILLASAALAHDAPMGWAYPMACCSGADCREADPGEIVEAPGGWRVVPTGEVLGYHDPKVRQSPDGHWHRCLRNPRDVRSETLCVFVVVGGS